MTGQELAAVLQGLAVRLAAWAAKVRKALTAAAGLVAEVLATGLLHGEAEAVAQGVLATLTVLGVYRVPNRPAAMVAAGLDSFDAGGHRGAQSVRPAPTKRKEV